MEDEIFDAIKRAPSFENVTKEVCQENTKLRSRVKELKTKLLDFEDKYHRCNVEQQEARKMLIKEFDGMTSGGDIGVKRMGELDSEPFYKALQEKYHNNEDADFETTKMCSDLQATLYNPDWFPFIIANVDGVQQEYVDEEDETLARVREDIGEGGYMALKTALLEMKEYDPSRRRIIPELWNFKHERKATLIEGLHFLIDELHYAHDHHHHHHHQRSHSHRRSRSRSRSRSY